MRGKDGGDRNYHAGLYLRLSKEDEAQGQSGSISNQRILLERYVQEQGWEVAGCYIDDGYSGLHFDRPGFQRLLSDIEAGMVNLVLTKDLSRLGRDYIDTGYYLERYFPSRQVRYIALVDGIDTFDPSSAQNDMGPFKSVMNDLYAKDISKKVRAVMDTKREAGQFIGAFAPYGYQKDAKNKNQLFIDGPAAEVVRRIFEEYLAGQSMAGIARRLSQEGVLPPARYKTEIQRLPYHNANAVQGVWRAETIRTILGNPTYAGDLAQGKNEKLSYKLKASHKRPRLEWTVVPDTHEAIISKESFQLVQQLLESRSGRSKPEARVHLLSGLVFCRDCGRPMTFCKRSSGGSFVLICSGYSRYGECQRHTTDEAQLERTVLKRLHSYAKQLLPPEAAETLLRACSGSNEALWLREQTHAQDRLRQLGSILQALYEDHAARRLEESEFIQLTQAYREEKKKLQNLLENDPFHQEDERLALRTAHELLYFEQPDRRLLCRMIRRITIGQGGAVSIDYTFQAPEPDSGI